MPENENTQGRARDVAPYGDSQYKPLSPWSYFLYSLLFIVPLIGFAFLIVFALDHSNDNRCNFARSYFCIPLLLLIIAAALLLIALVLVVILHIANTI